MATLKLIGRGAFSRVYRSEDSNVVLIKSCDPIKECMSLGWFPDSELFPKVTRIDNNMYEMDYIGPCRAPIAELKAAGNDEHLNLYRELLKLNRTAHTGFDLIKDIKGLNIPNRDMSDIIEALEACMNYGEDIAFEISPRNIRISDGKLILMDCFYQVSALRAVRQWKLSTE